MTHQEAAELLRDTYGKGVFTAAQAKAIPGMPNLWRLCRIRALRYIGNPTSCDKAYNASHDQFCVMVERVQDWCEDE